MKFILYLAAMLLAAGVVMAAGFDDAISAANKARAEGRYAEAEAHYQEALSLSPDNTDVLLQLGLVIGFQKRYEESLTVLKRGSALAPDYIDIRIAAARVKYWMGRPEEARKDVEDILARNPDNKPALDLQRQLVQVSAQDTNDWPWRLDLGYDRSRFTRVSRKKWHEGFFQITRDLTPTQIHFRVERGRRFGDFDNYYRVGAAHRLNDDLGGYINFGITPAAVFYPRKKIEAGADFRLLTGGGLIGATLVTLDLAQKDYATGDIRNIDPGLQQYLFDGRAWMTGRWINTYDLVPSKRLGGWSLRTDWQVMENLRLFGGMSNSAETDSGVTIETLSKYAGASLDVTQSISLNLAYTRDNRKNSYIRDVFSSGLSLRF